MPNPDPASTAPVQERILMPLAVLVLLLLAASWFALAKGSVPVSIREAVNNPASMDARIMWQVRFPWVLLAMFAGAGLSVVGTGFQAMLRNPLADPFILGMSGGASLGAVVFLTLGLHSITGPQFLPAAGFIGALGATLLVWKLGHRKGGSTYTMLLAGVVVNAMFGALIMFLISMAQPEAVHQTAIWLMGVLDIFNVPPALQAASGIAVLVSIFYFWSMSRSLNTLSLGDWTAASLGTDPGKTRFHLFIAGAVIVGAVTSIAGPIGFVGLIVPHALRMVLGADHRLLIPASALGGAAFLVFAGSVARMAFPVTQTQVPVGVLTAALGGPFFLWLLAKGVARHD